MVLTENWTLRPRPTMSDLVELAVRAEATGVDGVMVSDHVVLGASSNERGEPFNPRDYAMPGNQDSATPWPSPYVLLAAITIFFSAFNVMEASLPSLITKAAPPDAKGTATGIYSSSQFLGIFIGGVVGGWADQTGGSAMVFALTALIALLWLIASATMKQPSYLTTRLVRIGDTADAQTLAARLRQVPGVKEAVVIAEEKLAYLKVDSKAFDAAKAEALAGA